MLKEVAFDPRCISDFEYYLIFKQGIGFEYGRFISGCRKEWANEAHSYLKALNNNEIAPVKKKSISRFLNKIKTNKAGHFKQPNPRTAYAPPWLNWVNVEQQTKQFCTLVTEQPVVSALDKIKIAEERTEWKNPTSQRVRKEEHEIVDALEVVLFSSTEVIIIDQYFRITQNPVLNEMLNKINALKSVKKLTLVTSICNDNPIVGFNHDYGELEYIPDTKIVKAPERFFHDRFLLSDCVAFSSGQGFSIAGDGGANTKLKWSRISEEDAEDEINELGKAIKNAEVEVFFR